MLQLRNQPHQRLGTEMHFIGQCVGFQQETLLKPSKILRKIQLEFHQEVLLHIE